MAGLLGRRQLALAKKMVQALPPGKLNAVPDDQGWLPLHWAVMAAQDVDLVKDMVAKASMLCLRTLLQGCLPGTCLSSVPGFPYAYQHACHPRPALSS